MTGQEQEQWMRDQEEYERTAEIEPLTWLGCLTWVLAGFGVAGLVIAAFYLTAWMG